MPDACSLCKHTETPTLQIQAYNHTIKSSETAEFQILIMRMYPWTLQFGRALHSTSESHLSNDMVTQYDVCGEKSFILIVQFELLQQRLCPPQWRLLPTVSYTNPVDTHTNNTKTQASGLLTMDTQVSNFDIYQLIYQPPQSWRRDLTIFLLFWYFSDMSAIRELATRFLICPWHGPHNCPPMHQPSSGLSLSWSNPLYFH